MHTMTPAISCFSPRLFSLYYQLRNNNFDGFSPPIFQETTVQPYVRKANGRQQMHHKRKLLRTAEKSATQDRLFLVKDESP
jgi:hypothetical protein